MIGIGIETADMLVREILCNPHSAMAAMPLREWTRRLGALPAEAYDCFMVCTPYGFNRIQAWFARLIAANGRLPSDHRAGQSSDC